MYIESSATLIRYIENQAAVEQSSALTALGVFSLDYLGLAAQALISDAFSVSNLYAFGVQRLC